MPGGSNLDAIIKPICSTPQHVATLEEQLEEMAAR